VILTPKKLKVLTVRISFNQEHCLRLAEEKLSPRYERIVTEAERERKRLHPLVPTRVDPFCLSELAACCGLIKTDTSKRVTRWAKEVSHDGRETPDLYRSIYA
jgi:hypothetical protein